MFPISRFATIAAFGAILFGAATPALAQEPLTNLGPVGPREPILVQSGTQRVVAFYVPERGACAVNAVTWKEQGDDAPASTRIRVNLKPGQMVQLDGAQRQSMSLVCGADASTLALAAPPELIKPGSTGTN